MALSVFDPLSDVSWQKSTCGDKRPADPRNRACVPAPYSITIRSLCRSRAQDSSAYDRVSALIEIVPS